MNTRVVLSATFGAIVAALALGIGGLHNIPVILFTALIILVCTQVGFLIGRS